MFNYSTTPPSSIKRLTEQLQEQRQYFEQVGLEVMRLESEIAKNKKDTHELR
jgi:hypothetical protein